MPDEPDMDKGAPKKPAAKFVNDGSFMQKFLAQSTGTSARPAASCTQEELDQIEAMAACELFLAQTASVAGAGTT